MINPATYENHGVIIPEITDDQYIFGDQKLGDALVNENGQWGDWLPVEENQNIGLETMACTVFALLNCVETMLRYRYGYVLNLSDRFLAYTSGVTKYGNDPHKVAEQFKNFGDVYEADYPYTQDINTWEKFYAAPAKWLHTKALEIKAEYSFGHSWVTNPTQERMMYALAYSPLTAAVYAWQQNADGIYIRPAGAPSTHDVMIFGYLRNNYWLCFDSYTNNVKKLSWDFGFEAVKRYTLDRQVGNTVEAELGWQSFLYWMQKIIDSIRYGSFLGVARSSEWRHTRREYMRMHPACEATGTTKDLECHHIKSFWQHPELENDHDNLITLTRDMHLWLGHLGDFKSSNPDIRVDARILRDKIKTRR